MLSAEDAKKLRIPVKDEDWVAHKLFCVECAMRCGHNIWLEIKDGYDDELILALKENGYEIYHADSRIFVYLPQEE